MNWLRVFACAAFLGLAACSPPASQSGAPEVRPISDAAKSEMDRVNSAATLAMLARPAADMAEVATANPPAAASQAAAQADATPPQAAAQVAPTVQYDAGLVRLQVLLDRAHISPGVIDGYDGDNVRKAIAEYQTQNSLPVTGIADETLLQRLSGNDASPALITYAIANTDVAGPFAVVPQGLEAMSHLDRLAYASPVEGLAEKFHMDEDLLRLLNPGADFTQAGTQIVVANAGGNLNAQVASIEVDKQIGAVRGYDSANTLVAFYPASIGSPDAPAPSGDYAVRAVAFDPVYHYDPARLPTFGQTGHGALEIKAGPNNPVGAVWIALTLDTYGIHGTPDPQKVSKTQSHGCVRLTNWDATELGRAVRAGVPVHFVEQRQASNSRGAPG